MIFQKTMSKHYTYGSNMQEESIPKEQYSTFLAYKTHKSIFIPIGQKHPDFQNSNLKIHLKEFLFH